MQISYFWVSGRGCLIWRSISRYLFCMLGVFLSFWAFLFFCRAKGDAPKVTEPNPRFPAVFCENLRFSAKICGFLRFPAPSKCWYFQEKGRICENLRFSAKICVLGALCHLSSVTSSSPWFWVSGLSYSSGKPLTSTLLTPTFVFRSGGFPCWGSEAKWSLVATSL